MRAQCLDVIIFSLVYISCGNIENTVADLVVESAVVDRSIDLSVESSNLYSLVVIANRCIISAEKPI